MIWHVLPNEHHMPLPEFLCQRASLRSNKCARKLIDQGACSINGTVVRIASRRVCTADCVALIHIEDESPAILYEDDHLMLMHKPAGMTVDQQELADILRRSDLIPVHRLDKYTSGVLVVAKHHQARELLVTLFQQRSVTKQYVALVEGRFKNKAIINASIEEKQRTAHRVLFGIAPSGRGKSACSIVSPIIQSQQASVVAVRPVTGRTHQIRIHLASVGHPIIGDFVYGTQSQIPYYQLHSMAIAFQHPYTQQSLCIKTPIPSFFREMVSSFFHNDHCLQKYYDEYDYDHVVSTA